VRLSRDIDCFEVGGGSRLPVAGAAGSNEDSVLAALDFPPPDRIRLGGQNRFRGMVLDYSGRVARKLRVRIDGESVGDFPADRPSEDLVTHLPRIAAARNCRFDFELSIPEGAELVALAAIWEDGRIEPLFEYDLKEVRKFSGRLGAMRRALEEIPMPPGEIVQLTQGHRDVEGYRNSIIPGFWNMRRYLEACGISADPIRSVLDFGCGSGRLLTGWLLEESRRELAGCDSNAVLVDWARAHLPARVRIAHTSPVPPLPYRPAEFDFVFAVSVFTHLSFRTQELWARELARVLEPGGTLLATYHGRPYVDIFARGRLAEFDRQGHLEMEIGEEGSNEFASFHAPTAVSALFDQFELVAHFPEGRIGRKRVPFPLAGLQDVSVLRRR
jgi:SAM-dependent methyltransferase